jgi:hypothetical protein
VPEAPRGALWRPLLEFGPVLEFLKEQSSAVLVSRSPYGLCPRGLTSGVFPCSHYYISGWIYAASSCTVTAPSEFLSVPPSPVTQGPPERSKYRAPLLGFRSLQRKQTKEPAKPRLTSPGTFRSRGFPPPQRLPSPSPSQVYFTLKRSWDSPFRAFLLQKSGKRLSAPSALLPFLTQLVARAQRRVAGFRALFPSGIRTALPQG